MSTKVTCFLYSAVDAHSMSSLRSALANLITLNYNLKTSSWTSTFDCVLLTMSLTAHLKKHLTLDLDRSDFIFRTRFEAY